jgi:hypothetical protein
VRTRSVADVRRDAVSVIRRPLSSSSSSDHWLALAVHEHVRRLCAHQQISTRTCIGRRASQSLNATALRTQHAPFCSLLAVIVVGALSSNLYLYDESHACVYSYQHCIPHYHVLLPSFACCTQTRHTHSTCHIAHH